MLWYRLAATFPFSVSIVDVEKDGYTAPVDKTYDIFYAYGHATFPPVAAVGKSMNVYEYSPSTVASSKAQSLVRFANSGVISTYDALVVRDDQARFDAYVAEVQPTIVDMVTKKQTIPTIKHLQTSGKLDKLRDFVMHGAFADPFRRFSSLALPLLQKKLVAIAPGAESDNVAVIVEPQISSTFEMAVRNVMYHLGPQWSLMVIHSQQNEAFVKAAVSDLGNVNFVQSADALNSVEDYNKMLKKASFWKSLKAEKALIFQSDAVMLGSGIEMFMKYDYIGAPWDLDHNKEVQALFDQGELIRAVGNGGFSLRSVSSMISILESESAAVLSTDEPEDIFFAKHLDKDASYKMPSRRVAYSFCREEMILGLELTAMQTWPLALHAAWKYSASEVIYKILNEYLQSLSGTSSSAVAFENTYSFSGIFLENDRSIEV